MDFIIIYTTFQTREEASAVIKALLKKNLIACAGIHPVDSCYQWKGDIHTNSEVMVMMESINVKFDEAVKVIEEMHSYEEPIVFSWRIYQVSAVTKAWMLDVLECSRRESAARHFPM